MSLEEEWRKMLIPILDDFRNKIVQDINENSQLHIEIKRWLKTRDVKEEYSISATKLERLRIKEGLPFTRVGGSYYYRRIDLEKFFSQNLKSYNNENIEK